ncbi:MAG: YecA family protein [Lysobacteraceae bacterium]|nr:MAG: YecA family protein [Xanthomonadaceae bacterium]
MSESQLPSWSEVADAADGQGLAATPAELHGSLCGWVAAGGADTAGWLALVMSDPMLSVPVPGGALRDRAGAMFDWCRTFLGGFGLAVGDKALSEDGQEALGDLANLAAARVEDVDEEGDEESLTEIEEYLRMAVLLLHADCAFGPRGRQQLH